MSDPSNHPQSGGIAFGGGTGNDFVREFEEARDAALESGNTDGMIREEILSIRPHGTEAKSEEFVLPDFDPDVKPDEPQPTGDVPMNDPSAKQDNTERPYTGFRLPEDIASFAFLGASAARAAESSDVSAPVPAMPSDGDFLFDPAAEEPEGELPDDEEEEEDEKPRGFKGLFSENAFLTTTTLILGGICAAFTVVFIVTLFMRDMMFSNVLALPLTGLNVTYTFKSALMPLLKVLLYLVPFAAIFFGAALIVTDKLGQHYGKKMLVVIVILLLIAVGCTAFDMSYSHLLF